MGDPAITTYRVVGLVEQFVRQQASQNDTTLDESAIYSLHLLAAQIYSAGYADGGTVVSEMSRHEARRERDRTRPVEDRLDQLRQWLNVCVAECNSCGPDCTMSAQIEHGHIVKVLKKNE